MKGRRIGKRSKKSRWKMWRRGIRTREKLKKSEQREGRIQLE